MSIYQDMYYYCRMSVNGSSRLESLTSGKSGELKMNLKLS